MYHRRHKEGEVVLASLQGVALFDFEHMPTQIYLIKLFEHGKCFFIANNGQTREAAQQFRDGVTMIWLNVVDHQVVQVATV